MKLYLAFCGETYYPSSGLGDLIGAFDTEEEAVNACREKRAADYFSEWRHWVEVWSIDLATKEVAEVVVAQHKERRCD